ncbi:apoptosis regulatory protein Siva-like [Pseudomyrmex gracilis]|uniref:apoptosis regulatory protein Siva-like n=1 Tax=Pseudomyrmex gracilis TaxID=219809 RepID=UPI0009959909|nr:apoptosis regulatory protein Siva-like [Pseudomyrmex gracilis]
MKRACSFEDDFVPQLKVHVGQKQVNNGVSSDVRMKNVYDRTLSLLKAGAKARSQKLNTSDQENSIDLSSPRPPYKFKSNLKQMLLTNKLQLQTSDKVVNDVRMDICGCCRVINQFTRNKCYYCDQILCSSCLSTCVNCLESFCQNCSLPVYNNQGDIKCFHCY